MQHRYRLLAAVATLGTLGALGMGGAARAATINSVALNFNGSDTFTPNFKQVTGGAAPTAAQSFTYSATGGVLDNAGAAGGGLVAPTDSNGGTGTTAYYTGGTADLTTRSYTVSEMFLRAAGTAGNRPLQIGFGNNSNLGFNGANGLDFFSARVDANAATGQDALEFQVQPANGGPGATTSLSRTNYNVNTGHWYLLTGTFSETSTASGTFNLNASLFDYGTDGVTVPASPVLTISNTFTDAALAGTGGSALNVGFRNNDNTVGSQFDNFTISSTPEPACLGLIGVGALALLSRRRRA